MKEFLGVFEQAKKRWPKGVAVGRLSVARSDKRDPLLCFDSTIPNVDAKVQMEDKSFNPCVDDIVSAKVVTHLSEGVGLTIDVCKADKKTSHPRRRMGASPVPAPRHALPLHSVPLWSAIQCSLVEPHGGSDYTTLPRGGWLYVDDFLCCLEEKTGPLIATCICCFMHLFGCPTSWHKIELGQQVRWIGLDINFFSCFWQIPQDKRVKAFQTIQKVSRQGNERDRVDLERLVILSMRFSESMPALRPWLSDFSLSLVRPTGTLLSVS